MGFTTRRPSSARPKVANTLLELSPHRLLPPGSPELRRVLALSCVACTMLVVLSAPCSSATQPVEPGFEVRDARTRLVDGVHRLDANIDFEFSPEALHAMDNGVPLTVLVEIEIWRERRLLDKRVAKLLARYRIETHPLSNHYVLKNLNSGETRTYRSFDEMNAKLGTISDLPMLDDQLLRDDRRYNLRLRARLDIEALPAPLRPVAYLSSPWRLTSEWYEWSLER